MKKSMFGFGALVVLAATAMAGDPTPGDQVVDQCVTDLNTVETAFNTRGQAIVDAVAAKLTLLDSRGATDEKLTLEANKAQAKLLKLEVDCIKVANKTTQKCFVKLANFDEADLVQQITDADGARDTTVGDIGDAAEVFEDDISTALANELGD